MNWKPSKEHFEFIRTQEWINLPNGLSYNLWTVDDILFVIFSPTYGINEKTRADDWAANLDFFPKSFDIFPGSKIQAHEGIAQQYLGIRETVMHFLYSGTIKHILISGYSQGGAVTQAAVQDIGFHIDRDKLNVTVEGISYDGPRFFGRRKNKLIKESVKNRLIIIKGHWDPVVHVPLKYMPTFFSFRWKPFKIRLCKPHITFWKDYGKVIWIGKIWKVFPLQHLPEEIAKNLLEKFK
jgi:hypothetical protein